MLKHPSAHAHHHNEHAHHHLCMAVLHGTEGPFPPQVVPLPTPSDDDATALQSRCARHRRGGVLEPGPPGQGWYVLKRIS